MSKIDLGKDRVSRIFIKYAIPSIFSMLSMITAWIVDGIFIGRYVGADGLTAVNMSFPVIALIVSIGVLFGTGGITLAGIKRGSKELKEANNIFSVTFTILLVQALLMGVLISLFLEKISLLLGADENVKAQLATYIRFIFPFAPAFMLAFTMDMFIRTDGFPNFPVKCSLFTSALNILLDYLFVAKLGFGIAGAAAATGLAQLTLAVMFLFFIITRTGWKFVIPKFHLKDIKAMVYNGSSEMVNELAGGITAFAFNFIIMKRLGYMGVAAFSIAQYSSTIAFAIFFGNSQAIHSGVSYNIGAKNLERVGAFKKIAVRANILCGALVFILLQFFGKHLIALFTKGDANLLNISHDIMRNYSFAFLIMGVNIALSMFFTASNLPKESMMVALTRSLFGILVGLGVLPLILGDRGIWLTVLFAELVTLYVTLKLSKKAEKKLEKQILVV